MKISTDLINDRLESFDDSIISQIDLLFSDLEIKDIDIVKIKLATMKLALKLNECIFQFDASALPFMGSLPYQLSGSIEPGFVYIAKQLNEENVYKIGSTSDLHNRLACFTTGNAYIEIVGSLKTRYYRQIERHLHKVLNCHRIKNEWFLLPEPVLSNIISSYKFNLAIEAGQE